jgi:hypothetical protein
MPLIGPWRAEDQQRRRQRRSSKITAKGPKAVVHVAVAGHDDPREL